MWTLLAFTVALGPPALAEDPECTEPVEAYIAQVRERGERAAYLCLARRDDAGPALFAAVTAQPAPPPDVALQLDASGEAAQVGEAVDAAEAERSLNAVSRAFTLHLAWRLDQALTAEQVRALNPADQRLLRDAVYARRGRASPSAEHARVFEQFDWYQPDDQFTNGRLTEQDRANLEMIDHPPKPAPPPSDAPAADALADVGKAAAKGTGGCSAAAPVGVPWLLVPLVARRRGR